MGGYRESNVNTFSIPIGQSVSLYSQIISIALRFALRLFCFVVTTQKTLCPVAALTQKSPKGIFVPGAATGNRTRIIGTTNRCTNRCTIAAIYCDNVPQVRAILAVLNNFVELVALSPLCKEHRFAKINTDGREKLF